MKQTIIRSTWMGEYGYRLDCQPYVGGALETKLLLKRLSLRKDPLYSLTAGFEGGIYNGPKFSRTWVESLEYGVPFVGSSSMLHADLSDLPLLSKKQAFGRQLRHLELKPGMSLISCSGTIGNMAYARREMDGIWSSQHIMKVVPDPAKIPPGYLYTYLRSTFGVPLVVSGTYGSIIQSIEPHHLTNLPVPRLSDDLEDDIHALIEESSVLRSQASERKRKAIIEFIQLCGVPELKPTKEFSTPLLGSASSGDLASRMDSTYYIEPCAEARAAFDSTSSRWRMRSLGEVAEVFIPTIFKRLYADDPDHGYLYITGADVFCIQPKSSMYLMRRVAHEHRLLLESGMIVLHEAGQRYGLIGHGVMVGRTLDGFACTNNMVRLIPHDQADTGFIFAALASEPGVRLLKREAAGSSIPHLDEGRVRALKIPWPDEGIRKQVAKLAHEARESWDRADELEKGADSKLVSALADAAN